MMIFGLAVLAMMGLYGTQFLMEIHESFYIAAYFVGLFHASCVQLWFMRKRP